MAAGAHAALKVFITGASSGLGEALALEYAAGGATLGLAGRRVDALVALRDRMVAAGAEAAAVAIYAVDVTEAAAVAEAARDFIERHGAPDVVVACAGIAAAVDLARADAGPVLRQLMDTNVHGTLATFQPFLAAMTARGRGRLVGIASVAADAFARRAVAAIAAGTTYAVIPWQMGWVARLLKVLPNGLYDAMMKAARRPRPAVDVTR